MMPDDELAAIRVRAADATPGPWMVVGGDGFEVYAPWDDDARRHGEVDQHIASCGDAARSHPNAVFIAHARTDIPALLAAYDALVAENARLRAGIESLRREHESRDCYCGALETCPASPELSIWRRAREEPICDCGAAEHNAKVDALLKGDT